MINHSEQEWIQWRQAVTGLLSANQVLVGEHRYTRPAPSIYEHQWLWDSCFHAIAYRWVDPAMAHDELVSVSARQVASGPDAGMVPHMTYWGGGGKELWIDDGRSTITQPPLIGTAAWLVYSVTKDRALLETLYPRLTAFHEWFDRRRDPDGDNLVSLIHPWEDWDSSPRWDQAMKLPPQFEPPVGTAARKALARVLPQYDHDPAALDQAGFFHVEILDFNAIRAADLEALANIADTMGKAGDGDHWRQRAQAVQAAVQCKLMEPAPHELEGMAEKPITVESASYFISLFGGCATPQQAARLVERLRQPDYWTPFPVPTSPTSSPSFSPVQYWRGNIWPSVNWLIYMGLKRYGFDEVAAELAEKTIEMVRKGGFREYFNPLTGEGLGAQSQSWTGLVIDMLAQERQIAR